MGHKDLIIAGQTFSSRLFLGTGKFSSPQVMKKALDASGAEIVTVALRRVDLSRPQGNILQFIDRDRFKLLPNTSGARTAKEAIFLAENKGQQHNHGRNASSNACHDRINSNASKSVSI